MEQSLYHYLINIVNIEILSLYFFYKTTQQPFKICEQHVRQSVWTKCNIHPHL